MKGQTNTTLVQLAKQGNPKAIETLLNRQLESKGITAKVDLKGNCLQILLESVKLPAKDNIVEFFRNSFTKLGSRVIKTVKIYGKQPGELFFDWHDSFDLIPELTTENVIESAKKGNTESIANLINTCLQAECIKAKAQVILKDGCLRVMLEAQETPHQELVITTLINELYKLNIESVNKLILYGKQINEDFPEWHQEINYNLGNNPEATVESLALVSVNRTVSEDIVNVSSIQLNNIDSIKLSNYLYYDFLQNKLYEPLSIRLNAEEEKDKVHDIVIAFNISNIEEDIKLSIRQVERQIIKTLEDNFNLTLDANEVPTIFYDISNYKFSNIRNAITGMEEAIREVLNFDFPEETDELKAFFKAGTKGLMDGFLVNTNDFLVNTNTETTVGIILGSILMPGIGTVIGGAVGNWFASNNQQKEYQKKMEEILNKYDAAKNKINECFQVLLHNCYEEISSLIYKRYHLKLITCEDFSESEQLVEQGRIHFENKKFIDAISFYDRAIEFNSYNYIAWLHKGWTLVELKQYEESLQAYDEGLKIGKIETFFLESKLAVLRILERYETVILLCDNALNQGYNTFMILYEKALSLHEIKRYQEAIETYDIVISIYSNDPDIYDIFIGKAASLVWLGDLKLALENLKKAVTLNPENSQEIITCSPSFDSLRNDERFIALMESSVGIDYSNFKKLLSEGKWKQADVETARLLCLAVRENEKRLNIIDEIDTDDTWLSSEHIPNIPSKDLNTINNLWLTYSNGKFGFSVQKEIYKSYGGTQEFNGEIRDKFGLAVGWRIADKDGNYFWRSSEDCHYHLESSFKGHLPSCLWAGVNDGWFGENRRDRLITLFDHLEASNITDGR
ncbi:GUN4 domain-containing protein [Chrysosporum bergii ANA360D]|uniref:GUN4 domain-containing protein n=1 Tax=Chrysosporum bergii ANA360D TaxID=617107 RepID=A0AA43GQT5_9CYAN|nr:GUN4 domain-containing protein [Chrysosporum bergii]MDH6059132.1 GUN4 domain-containing protein [Chrysosporum bergii ANA360D]